MADGMAGVKTGKKDPLIGRGTLGLDATGWKTVILVIVRGSRVTLIFAPAAIGHLEVMGRKDFGLIRRTIDEPLSHTPREVTRNGKPIAVLIAPVDDDDLERLLLARSPRFQRLLDESRRSIQAGKGLSEKAFWKALAEREKADR